MFSNMLQMYYQFVSLFQTLSKTSQLILNSSARILLANYEVRLEVEYQRGAIQEPTQIDRSRFEIQKSSVAITELLRELIRIDMVKCLPVSAYVTILLVI
jgi:hypothetical protein